MCASMKLLRTTPSSGNGNERILLELPKRRQFDKRLPFEIGKNQLEEDLGFKCKQEALIGSRQPRSRVLSKWSCPERLRSEMLWCWCQWCDVWIESCMFATRHGGTPSRSPLISLRCFSNKSSVKKACSCSVLTEGFSKKYSSKLCSQPVATSLFGDRKFQCLGWKWPWWFQ
jgi:hypothetical protein